MEKDTLSTAVSEPVILRNGSQPSIKGPDAWFTGTVRIDPLFPAHTPARASSAYVTFEPGARTAWHTHPLGQALIITAGVGRVQVQGWADSGGPPRRYGLVPSIRQTLARSRSRRCHDPYFRG